MLAALARMPVPNFESGLAPPPPYWPCPAVRVSPCSVLATAEIQVRPIPPAPRYTLRQASLALGGLRVNTALTPADGNTNVWLNGDSRGNLFAGAGYSVSNDFQFQLAAGVFNGIEPRHSFMNTYAGEVGLNLRFGAKAMVSRPSEKLLFQGSRKEE